MKKCISAFFKRTWQALKCTALCCSRGNKESPLWPHPVTDPSHLEQMDYQIPDDPQHGPSGLEAAGCQDSGDPQPGSSDLKPVAHPDPDLDDPKPGPSGLEATDCQDSDDPQPGSSDLEPVAHPEPDLDDPKPGPSGLEAADFQDSGDPQPGSSDLEPVAHPDLDDPQPGPSGLEVADYQDSDDPQPGPSGLELADYQDSGDPQPGSSDLEPVAHPDPDLDDPQPRPSGLEAADCQDSGDPQPGSSDLEPVAHPVPDLDDPKPGPSGLEAANYQDSIDPQPGSSDLKPVAHPEPDLDDPKPGPSGLEAADCQDSDDPQPRPTGLELTPDTNLADPKPAKRPFYLLYEVGEMLGSGSFGSVFKGTRIYDCQQVAIKFIHKRASDRFIHIPGYSKPLFAEVALNLLMQKPPRSQHFLQMYQWFDEPEQCILILEHPHPCETLQEFIWHNGGHLDETLACGLMLQAVLAVKDCLDRGVYHNDIKMDNILVNTETLQLKLIDFGCGFLLNSGYVGSKFRGRLSQRKPYADPATVLSLGVILFRMVNGIQTIITAFDDLKFVVDVSKECSDVISQCLKRDRAKRATLEQLLGHEWFQQVDGSGAA